MKKSLIHRGIIPALLILLLNSGVFAQELNKISLDGTWKFRKAGTTKWLDGRVPGDVYTDLQRNNVITDPYMGDNEKYQQWVSGIGWEYRKVFFVEDSLFIHRNFELVCNGLDTYANVFLNDSLILVADNMFKTWYSSIKLVLRTGTNTIKIQFPAVTDENKRRFNWMGYKIPGNEKTVCRKAAYQFGWNNGPSFITSGIWQPMYITYWDFINILGVKYVQETLDDSVARLTAEFTLMSTLSDSAHFKISVNGNTVAEVGQLLKKGSNVIPVDFVIKNPERWWCNGMGKQALYTCSHQVYFGGKLVGQGSSRIGLRTLEFVRKEDSLGRSNYFRLNGVPLFIKGAVYVPQDNFLSRVRDTNYLNIVKDAAAANMNMLRVWGGGIYEKDAFYDYCDEYGILVWQDFMFANIMYPTYKPFQSSVQAEAIQNLLRIHDHPCIAIWSGNNEFEESGGRYGYSGQKRLQPRDTAEINSANRALYDDILKTSVKMVDGHIPYITSFPETGWGIVYTSPSFPEMNSVKKFTNPGDFRLDFQVIKAHLKDSAAYFHMDEMLLKEYNKPKNFTWYTFVTQLVQAEKAKAEIESFRRSAPSVMGTMFWQMNDCWPGISPSATDYYGRKKALAYLLPQLYANTLVSPVIDDKQVKVYVVSNNAAVTRADLVVELVDFSGKSLMKKSVTVDIPANGSVVAFDSELGSLTKNRKVNEIVLLATLKKGEEVISENKLYFDIPKNMILKVPVITKTLTPVPEGYKLDLTTDQYAKDVSLTMPFKGELSDNFFDLFPGRTKTIIYKVKKAGVDIAPLIRISSLADTY